MSRHAMASELAAVAVEHRHERREPWTEGEILAYVRELGEQRGLIVNEWAETSAVRGYRAAWRQGVS